MNATEWKFGMSACFVQTLDRHTLEQYAENGVDVIEASDAVVDWEDFAVASKDTGVEVWSFHLPFWPFESLDPCSPDEQKRQRTIQLHKDCLDRAALIGAKIAVFHPSAEPNRPEDREMLLGIAKRTLKELAEYAAQYDIIIAVENLPRTCLGNCSADILELLSADSRLRVCFDTNHLLIEKAADFIEAVGDKIVTIHVSDYDFRDEKHWLPYEGDIDWVGLVTALENVGYKGPFMYEVNSKARPTIVRPRDLTFRDVRENYLACVNKVPATPPGVRDKAACEENAFYGEKFD